MTPLTAERIRAAILSCEALYDGSLYEGNRHVPETDEDFPIIDEELLDGHVVPHVLASLSTAGEQVRP